MVLPGKTLSLVLVTILIISATGIWWGLPNHVSWSSDDLGGPLTLGHIYHVFSNGYRNPPFHFFVNAVFYAPYLGFLYLTGGIQSPAASFPYGFLDPVASMTVLHMITRAINLGMAVGIAFFVYLISKEMFNERKAALLSALMLGLSPLFVVLSKIGRLDVPMVFHTTISLYLLIRVIKGGRKWDYVLFGLSMALALATKLQSVSFYVIIVPVLLYFHFGEGRGSYISRLLDRRLLLMIIVFLAASFLAHNLIDVEENIFRLNYWLGGHGVSNWAEFSNTLEGHSMLFIKTSETLAASIGISSLLAAISGALCMLLGRVVPRSDGRSRRFMLLLLAIIVSQYLFVIAPVRFILPRYLLQMIVPLAVFGGWFLSSLWQGGRTKKAAVIIILTLSLSQALAMDHIMLNDSRYHAEQWMLSNVDKHDQIELYVGLEGMPRLDIMGYTNINRMDMDMETLDTLQERGPDYVLMRPLTYRTPGQEEVFYNSIVGGELGYLVEKRFKSPSFLFPDVYPDYVNPEIIILKKA